MESPHPYFPKDVVIPNYVPNEGSTLEILAKFGAITVVVVGGTYALAAKSKLGFSSIEKAKICWLSACFFIHFFLEGYFSLNYDTFPEKQNFLARCWKEYSKGDSRYILKDTFTVCMETITAFIDGPLCLIAVYAFLTNKPYRYIVQLIVSLCQLYGDILYLSTEAFEGFQHGEIFHPIYFWFYFFFMNILWIIIPFGCIVESFHKLSKAQSTDDSMQKKKA
ncbi:DgyrCDS4448 [Dimorphilus gyrociliatus]|uniref:DgyrCDS4448 n=1 Tax=Dimorphilus gyrociliatus TaxID=2664684 RepID=A0A7I8VJP4_9ANNE|nr:DgyrCDS4448 [Dimorphilus gyrociliatus]